MIKYLFILFNWIRSVVSYHFSVLYTQTDPLQSPSANDLNVNSLKLQNIFPIIILLYVPIYGIFGLPYDATGKAIELDSLLENPYIFTHQIVPRSIWTLVDIAVGLDVIAAVPIFMVKLLTENVSDAFAVSLKDNNQVVLGAYVLTVSESKRILYQRKQIKRLFLHFLLLSLWAVFLSYLLFCVFFLNRLYTSSLFTVLYWPAFGLFSFYIIFCLFGSMVYIILVSRYIQIHQEAILAKLKRLNDHLRKQTGDESIPFHPYWIIYRRVNSDTVATSKLIQEYARYCGPIISIAIPFYISIQCYLLCVILFMELPLEVKQLFLCNFIEMNLFLFVITDQCARVIKFNQKLEAQNQKFYWNFVRKYEGKISGFICLKAEMFQSQRRLHKYAFRVLANYRITGKSYFLIVSYISTFFMFVTKGQYV